MPIHLERSSQFSTLLSVSRRNSDLYEAIYLGKTGSDSLPFTSRGLRIVGVRVRRFFVSLSDHCIGSVSTTELSPRMYASSRNGLGE